MKETQIYLAEVLTREIEITFDEGMLVGRSKIRGSVSEQVDRRVMSQRLDEHASASGTQHAGDLRIDFRKVQVMQDGRAAHEIERVVGELEALPIHPYEVGPLSNAVLVGARPRLLDRHVRDVNSRHAGTLTG